MQLIFVLLTILLLAVAVFALQNHHPVTLQFLYWRLDTSVAILTLGAIAAGAMMAGLVGLASRLRRWRRARPQPVPAPASEPPVVRRDASSPAVPPPARPGDAP